MHEWPQISGAAIVAKAREFDRTPYHAGARLKKVGIDCAGLAVCVFAELGVTIADQPHCTLTDPYQVMADGFSAIADALDSETPWEAGDIILFRNPGAKILAHCAIATGEGKAAVDRGMIHAWNTPSINLVAEHPAGRLWGRSVAVVFRYKGVTA